MKYSTLQFEKVVDGNYLVSMKVDDNWPNKIDTLITYEGIDKLFVLEF